MKKRISQPYGMGVYRPQGIIATDEDILHGGQVKQDPGSESFLYRQIDKLQARNPYSKGPDRINPARVLNLQDRQEMWHDSQRPDPEYEGRQYAIMPNRDLQFEYQKLQSHVTSPRQYADESYQGMYNDRARSFAPRIKMIEDEFQRRGINQGEEMEINTDVRGIYQRMKEGVGF